MENGRIVASGTNETLLKDCGIYREIVQQQTKGGEEDV